MTKKEAHQMTKYRVSGPTGYRGHKPGDVVELDLTDQQEARALERGSLTKVRAAAQTIDNQKKEGGSDG